MEKAGYPTFGAIRKRHPPLMLSSFNIRVYGILVNDKKQVLVSDERIPAPFNLNVTKFPGGGLELGEGLIDCVKRECLEEMGIRVEVVRHLYTTDFFQQSAFNKTQQLIAVYYQVRALEPFDPGNNNHTPLYPESGEYFRFIDWDHFDESLLSLPVDKIAARLLKEQQP
jgi:8-oxo-dGTP diphosphatase